MHTPLLFEIGTEELPAHGLAALGEQLLTHVEALLSKHHLSVDNRHNACFATPRRLGVFIAACADLQPEQQLTRKGPKVSVDGTESPAALGFAKSCGVTFADLTLDGDYYSFTTTTPGKTALSLLPELLNRALSELAIARPMRWGNRDTGFVRPVKWVLALLGPDIIDMECFGIKAGRLSYGHRFMAPNAISLASADRATYENALADAHVIASFAKRQASITLQLTQKISPESRILSTRIDPNLLTEVTGLVEWPVALTIPFDSRFLKLPSEVLIASMQSHQKCFAIEDASGQLQAAFITISNIDSVDPDDVIKGNARVMHARLSDAEFFYERDLNIPLADYQITLANMTFQHHLGSMQDKAEALARLSTVIAPQLGADAFMTAQAAMLAKSDLCCQMVNEFPELQGLMGRTYALHQGLAAEVASALFEHYLPKFAGDSLPSSPMGISLALADRLLNLTGIFGVGLIPTGDKDPFALRRAALGVIRILLAQDASIALMPLIHASIDSWRNNATEANTANLVVNFMLERLRYYWLEQEALSAFPREQLLKAIEAVLSHKTTIDECLLKDCQARLVAILDFQASTAASALASANKRVNNLLQKEKCTSEMMLSICSDLFEQQAEWDLHQALTNVQLSCQDLLTKKDYVAVLQQLATLKEPVDAFFADVMVLAKAPTVRANRLALLAALQHLLSCVADLSCL